MNTNVGLADRIIRVWIGLGLMAIAYVRADDPYAYLGWLGIIPFLSGLSGWCVVYRFLGINTVRS